MMMPCTMSAVMVLRMIRNGSYIDCIESDLALALVAPGFASRSKIQPRKIHAVQKAIALKFLTSFDSLTIRTFVWNRKMSVTGILQQ